MQSPRAQLRKTRETSIDPAGVILSLLEELSADEFRRIIGLSGLSVDWQLSKEESYSHATRKRAYVPKVQAELGVLTEEDRLQVLAMVAAEMCNRLGDLGQRTTVSLQTIGWQVSGSHQSSGEADTVPAPSSPMTRDKYLMRLLLIKVRDEKAPEDLQRFSEAQQVYTADLLIQDKLVEGKAIKDGNGNYVSAVMTNLTSAGHDFLEAEERRQDAGMTTLPPEIDDSLRRFQIEHPEPSKACFLMMRFGTTTAHNEITETIKRVLGLFGIRGLRADDKQYNDDVFGNIRTYLHGCGFGVAVFERLEKEDFNPNVSLEVGYLLALGKPVLLLKDKTLQQLPTDLIGKLYRVFDPQHITASIPSELEKWLKDKDLIRLGNSTSEKIVVDARFGKEIDAAKNEVELCIVKPERTESFINTCTPLDGKDPYQVFCHHLVVQNLTPRCFVQKCTVHLVAILDRCSGGFEDRCPFAVPRLMEWAPAEHEPILRSFKDKEIFDFGQSRTDTGTFELNYLGRFHQHPHQQPQGGVFHGDCAIGQTRQYAFKVTAENYIPREDFIVQVAIKNNDDATVNSRFKTEIIVIGSRTHSNP